MKLHRFPPARRNLLIIYIVVSAASLLAGCGRSRVVSALEESEVFSLEYGNFEDELNLFDFSGIGTVNASLAMRDGFFYIANGSARKIMALNSYGDLLTLFYNDEVNPVPSFASTLEGVQSNRTAVTYPFNQITSVAVDGRKYLYVVDRLPVERQEQDAARGLVLAQIVLRFDAAGNFVDYLGQEGPGGTPFPFVKSIYVTNRDELVVVCTTTDGPVVYWFSKAGYLMYTVPVQKRNVPDPFAESKDESWLEVENIVPDYSDRTLYVKVDYFSAYMDDASRVQSGINYDGSMLYALDVDSGQYAKPLSISPYVERSTQDFSNATYEIPYDFLGVSETGWFFFIVSTDTGFTVQMVQGNGQRILTRRLTVDRAQSLFYTFSLSNGGILSALLVQGDRAVVDWWRTDNLIQAVIKN